MQIQEGMIILNRYTTVTVINYEHVLYNIMSFLQSNKKKLS